MNMYICRKLKKVFVLQILLIVSIFFVSACKAPSAVLDENTQGNIPEQAEEIEEHAGSAAEAPSKPPPVQTVKILVEPEAVDLGLELQDTVYLDSGKLQISLLALKPIPANQYQALVVRPNGEKLAYECLANEKNLYSLLCIGDLIPSGEKITVTVTSQSALIGAYDFSSTSKAVDLWQAWDEVDACVRSTAQSGTVSPECESLIPRVEPKQSDCKGPMTCAQQCAREQGYTGTQLVNPGTYFSSLPETRLPGACHDYQFLVSPSGPYYPASMPGIVSAMVFQKTIFALEDPFFFDDPILAYEDPFFFDDPILAYEDPFFFDDPILAYEDPFFFDDPILAYEDPFFFDDPILAYEDPFFFDDPILAYEDPFFFDDPILAYEDPFFFDDPILAYEDPFFFDDPILVFEKDFVLIHNSKHPEYYLVSSDKPLAYTLRAGPALEKVIAQNGEPLTYKDVSRAILSSDVDFSSVAAGVNPYSLAMFQHYFTSLTDNSNFAGGLLAQPPLTVDGDDEPTNPQQQTCLSAMQEVFPQFRVLQLPKNEEWFWAFAGNLEKSRNDPRYRNGSLAGWDSISKNCQGLLIDDLYQDFLTDFWSQYPDDLRKCALSEGWFDDWKMFRTRNTVGKASFVQYIASKIEDDPGSLNIACTSPIMMEFMKTTFAEALDLSGQDFSAYRPSKVMQCAHTLGFSLPTDDMAKWERAFYLYYYGKYNHHDFWTDDPRWPLECADGEFNDWLLEVEQRFLFPPQNEFFTICETCYTTYNCATSPNLSYCGEAPDENDPYTLIAKECIEDINWPGSLKTVQHAANLVAYLAAASPWLAPDSIPASCEATVGAVAAYAPGGFPGFLQDMLAIWGTNGTSIWGRGQEEFSSSSAPLEISIPEPAEKNRCALFADEEKSLILLDVVPLSSAPTLYLSMPNGVPGLEVDISNDKESWEYNASLGDIAAKNCSYLGYKGRLYCNFILPNNYMNSVRPLEIYVNGCDEPIFTDREVNIVAGGGSGTSRGGNNDGGNSCAPTTCGPGLFWDIGLCMCNAY